MLQCLFTLLGQGRAVKRFANCTTLEEQRRMWDSSHFVYFFKHGPAWLVWLVAKFVALVMFNRTVLWWAPGWGVRWG